MKIKTFSYFAKQGLKSIKRNRVMSFASISTVAASLFIFGIFMLMMLNVNGLVKSVENTIEIKAFLNSDLTTLKERDIENKIKELPGVKEVVYESKEQALENFKKQLGEKKDLADGLKLENPLPASFIIKVDNPKKVFSVSTSISEMEGVYKVKDGKQAVEKIIKFSSLINIISIILMLILGVISISLISNTIKLTVFARKREIGIMKYIGATDWFIRWPFILEGMLLGLFGAIISICILALGYGYAVKVVTSSVSMFSLLPLGEITTSLFWEFSIIGISIGGLGSFLSIRKFLVV